MILRLANSQSDFDFIEGLYEEAFEPSVRKEMSFMQSSNNVQFLCLEDEGVLKGFCVVVKANECVIIDYLAVRQSERSKGIGSLMLELIKKRYANKTIFLELERLRSGESQTENNIRALRHSFYAKNGFVDAWYNLVLNGNKMQVMKYPSFSGTVEQYLACYEGSYGEGYVQNNIAWDKFRF